MIDIWWNKYYGYNPKFPDEDNYRAICGIVFGRECTLVCVWKRLSFYLNVSEKLHEWDELKGPPKKKWYKLEILKK